MLMLQAGLVQALCFLVNVLYLNVVVEATCYTPNGNEASGDSPCSSDGNTMCCPGPPGASVCLSNGLCFVPSQNAVARSSCTDQSWSSSACTNHCKDVLTDQFCQLTPCIDASFCCGLGPSAWGCCDSGSGFRVNIGSFINMQGGDTETVTETITRTERQTDTETEIETETETETSVTTVVTRADGGVFTATKVITETTTTLTTASICPGGSILSSCPTGSSTTNADDQSGNSVDSSVSCPSCATKQVTVGAGVGIPLAAALACSLLLWRRKRTPIAATVVEQPPQQHQYAPQPVQQGYGTYAMGGGYVRP